MPRLRLAACLGLTATVILPALFPAEAQVRHMPVAEIRPGMVGLGRTVFSGTRVEEFRAQVLGVIENVMGPQRNLILAKLEGGPLADTGVIAGMSGSPVYIDGRLVGAVAYSLGSFSKEPIAGITPIDEMTTAAALTTSRPAAARLRVEYPITRESFVAAFRKALNWNRPFTDRQGDARVVAGATSVAGFDSDAIGTLLRPIATPLVMSGFSGEVAETLTAIFRDQGFLPAAAGAAAPTAGLMPFDGPLKPGDAVGVNLVTGDLMLGSTGTVTHVDGDRVYAFGHPMYNIGPIEFPMTRAYVYTVLPSLFSSMKLSTTGETIGTLLQDRATTIAGRLGPAPRMMPVSMQLTSERGDRRTFHFEVVRDQLFGPLMTYSALLQTLTSYERQFGVTTYAVQATAELKNRGTVTFENVYSGDKAATPASSFVVAPLTALMTHETEPVEIERLELNIRSAEQVRTATLERVWLDDRRPRPGKTVPLKVLLRTFRGEDVIKSVPIEIPSNASGNLSIIVSDGQRLQQAELRELRLPQRRTVEQIVRAMNHTRRNNTLYVKLMSGDPGAVVNGETLSSLPPSVLAVMESDRSGGTFNPLSSATLGEWSIPTDHAVNGVRTVTLSLASN
ncbi:MAG: SpoIVB peptidase S55 domain-containing protein [Vicinamibacterales bacterium]